MILYKVFGHKIWTNAHYILVYYALLDEAWW